MAEATRGREHDQSNINVTKDGKLISLLNESISTLGECNLAICVVFYSLYLQFNATHLDLASPISMHEKRAMQKFYYGEIKQLFGNKVCIMAFIYRDTMK